MKNFSAKLNTKEDVWPILVTPRSVPFAIRKAIETELKRLGAEGIIDEVPNSKWTAPFVQNQYLWDYKLLLIQVTCKSFQKQTLLSDISKL